MDRIAAATAADTRTSFSMAYFLDLKRAITKLARKVHDAAPECRRAKGRQTEPGRQ
ncbi:protein of unknown function (plasmid) [Cupriavidus taiwanensis]|uniref:Uncharacterized protein n=1 Tax=Cupriavidus taiwanensis TaxID=164546 RepID=A0A375ISB4_9BURK|nr:protein of unknown function [Cupriavidus taiwanensis]